MNFRASILLLCVLFPVAITVAQERIITAGSALTETVCALGYCDKIVASDRTSLFPEQIQKLPSIGYRSGINAEGILSLKPTLMIAEKGYVDDAVLTQLASTSIRLVIIDRKNNFDDTKKFIMQIAAALGKEAAGRKLVAKNEEQLAEAAKLLEIQRLAWQEKIRLQTSFPMQARLMRMPGKRDTKLSMWKH